MYTIFYMPTKKPVKKQSSKKKVATKRTRSKKTQTKPSHAPSILLQTNTMMVFVAALLAPMYSFFIIKVGGTFLDATLAWVLFAASTGITMMSTVGLSTQQKQRELYIVLGYLTIAIGMISLLFAHTIVQVLYISVLVGIGNGLSTPMFKELCAKYHDTKNGYQPWHVLNYFVFAIGALLGYVLHSVFCFYIIFAMTALICSTAALYIYGHASHLK